VVHWSRRGCRSKPVAKRPSDLPAKQELGSGQRVAKDVGARAGPDEQPARVDNIGHAAEFEVGKELSWSAAPASARRSFHSLRSAARISCAPSGLRRTPAAARERPRIATGMTAMSRNIDAQRSSVVERAPQAVAGGDIGSASAARATELRAPCPAAAPNPPLRAPRPRDRTTARGSNALSPRSLGWLPSTMAALRASPARTGRLSGEPSSHCDQPGRIARAEPGHEIGTLDRPRACRSALPGRAHRSPRADLRAHVAAEGPRAERGPQLVRIEPRFSMVW
jgi:hypothetical protein